MNGLGRPLRTLRSQIQLLVGGLLVLLLVSAVATLLVERQVSSTQLYLRTGLRPAQVSVAMLGEAYVDQEAGARGYQLTGDSVFLQPYNAGLKRAAALQRQLHAELASDARSRVLLAQVGQAASAWLAQEAIPAAGRPAQAAVPHGVPLSQALTQQRLFDSLRGRMAALARRVNELAAAKVAAINSAEGTAHWLTVLGGAIGLVLVFVAVLVLRNSLARPLARLVAQVQRVADGELGHSVDVARPQELSTVARAVETMRVQILAHTARMLEMQRQLDLASESERIAGGLHDVVIRRLSQTGLILQSAAGRYPAAASALSSVVDEIDDTIRELRRVIFGLRAARRSGGGLRSRVLDLIGECEPSLGFTPHIQFDGIPGAPITEQVADELIAALRQTLSGMAHHASEAEIKINVTDGVLRLQVISGSSERDARPAGAGPGDARPAGAPPHGGEEPIDAGVAAAEARPTGAGTLEGVAERARLFGGTCTLGSTAAGGTVIDWRVPANGHLSVS